MEAKTETQVKPGDFKEVSIQAALKELQKVPEVYVWVALNGKAANGTEAVIGGFVRTMKESMYAYLKLYPLGVKLKLAVVGQTAWLRDA